jgi:outer membrane protein assembly factor BamB
MDRRSLLIGGVGIVALLALLSPAQGFIEKLTHLGDIIQDSDQIFVAQVKALDPSRPSMVLERQTVLKGDRAVKRMPINLSGDKEKHAPELLKRLAVDLPVVVFVTELNKRRLVLAYTNGTWFQVLGQEEGGEVRWAFTHIEIYLRRTFRGTTKEMQEVVADAVLGKRKPPPADAKEKPGFGPVIEPFPPTPPAKGASHPQPAGPQPLLAVIILPFLMPVAALFNLLFPGILREKWRQYQVAVVVLLTQSTLIFTHFAVRNWIVSEPGKHAWLSDAALWIGLVAVAVVGLAIALVKRVRQGGPAVMQRPVRVEYLALGTLLLAGLAWGVSQMFDGSKPFRDEMGMVTAAAGLGLIHLLSRRMLTTGADRRAVVTTELVFLTGLTVVGAGLGWYLHQGDPKNLQANEVRGEWRMSRGNEARTGSLSTDDAGPRQPRLLWTFDPAERRGRISFHSSPTFVDGQLYIGAMHEVQAFTQGYLYCINAKEGVQVEGKPLPVGALLWRFSADGSMKPVYSTPIVHGGQVYVGEGYHQDQRCRLYCLDPATAALRWMRQTTSHVESSPCVLGTRLYFGAGDDGLLCVDAAQLETSADGSASPKLLWQVPGVHVDAAPLVADNRVFVGTIIGDVHQSLHALAVEADTGRVAWQVPAPLPVCSSPSYANGRVFFGLGNGKVNLDADRPAGAVWCLEASTGRRVWEYPLGNSVLATPALQGEHVFVACNDQTLYCLKQGDGQLVWKTKLGSRLAACPIVAGGRVYVLTSTASLVCLDATGGAVHWRFDELQEKGITDAYSSPMLAHGRLYFAAGGKVYCVGDAP